MKKIASSYERFFSKESESFFKVTETTVYVFKDNEKLVKGLFEIEIKVSSVEKYEEYGIKKDKIKLISFKKMIFIEIGRSRIEITASSTPVMASHFEKKEDGSDAKKVGLINQFTVSRVSPSIKGGENLEKIINEVNTQINS